MPALRIHLCQQQLVAVLRIPTVNQALIMMARIIARLVVNIVLHAMPVPVIAINVLIAHLKSIAKIFQQVSGTSRQRSKKHYLGNVGVRLATNCKVVFVIL